MGEDPFSPGTLYAGVYFGGLFVSKNSGQTWSPVQAPFATDSVFGLAFDTSHAGTIIVGTFQNGLFRTTDSGVTWTSISNGLGASDIEALGLDPGNPKVLLVSAGGNGYRSADGGATWQTMTLNVRTIFFDKAHPGRVYVGTYYNGLYRSDDDGVTFTLFTAGIGTNTVLSMSESSDGSTLYAGALQGVFQLSAGSAAWVNITGKLAWSGNGSIIPYPGNDKVLVAASDRGIYTLDNSVANAAWSSLATFGSRYLFSQASNNHLWAAASYDGLYVTSDPHTALTLSEKGIQNYFVEALAVTDTGTGPTLWAGTDRGVFTLPPSGIWSSSPDLKPQTIFSLTPGATPAGTMLAGTQTGGVWKTTNGGSNWSSIANGQVPRLVTSIAQFVDVKQVALAGATSGVYQTLDNGKTWNQTLLLSGVFCLATDPSIQASAYVGAAGGQVLRTTDYGVTWNPVQASGLPASDVKSLTVIPYDKIYAVLADGGVYATYTNGSSWLHMNSSSPYPASFVAGDPKSLTTAYIATQGGGVYKTTDFGQTWTQANQNLGGLYVYTILVDPQNTSVLYAGTNLGVYKSADKGGTWAAATNGLPSAPVLSLVMNTQSTNNLVASVLNHGVYRSVDSGATWSAAASGPPTDGPTTLALNPLFPAKMYAGTLNKGVYVSTDNGLNWVPSSQGLSVFIRGIAVDPNNTQSMYAAALTDGFYRSTDGGASWTNAGLDDRYLFGLTIDPSNTQTLYAATSVGVAKSSDAGLTWHDLGQHTNYLFSLVVDPKNASVLYVGSTQGKVYRSADGGQSWTDSSTGLPLGDVVHLAADSGTGALFADIDLNGLFTSTDGGATWSACGQIPVLKTSASTGLSIDANHNIYTSGDSVGVFRSSDDGQSWQSANNGVATAKVQSLLAARRQQLVLAGTSGAGVYRSIDNATTWQPATVSPKGSVVISLFEDPSVSGKFYAGTDTGFFVSKDSGLTWGAQGTGLPANVGISQILSVPASSVVYAVAGASGLFKSGDGGTTWAAVPTPASRSEIRGLGLGGTTQTLYAATLGAGFISSLNAGQNWSPAVTLANVNTVTNVIIVDPTNPKVLYAATGGNGVLKSGDGGLTWTPAISGLSQLYVVAMIMDPKNHNILFAGTAQGGVFETSDGGNTWHALQSGLSFPNIVSLATDPINDKLLFAGTEGGGVFRIQLP